MFVGGTVPGAAVPVSVVSTCAFCPVEFVYCQFLVCINFLFLSIFRSVSVEPR